jgi:hypothetical protein
MNKLKGEKYFDQKRKKYVMYVMTSTEKDPLQSLDDKFQLFPTTFCKIFRPWLYAPASEHQDLVEIAKTSRPNKKQH